MSIMLVKKKKYRFQVDCTAEELMSVSYLNAILFAKLRLLDGGTFSEESPRLEVRQHSVRWHKTFSFQCKMTANASTGVLDPCHCRISVRKEAQGGKSCDKLGFVDLNLANFAGKGVVTQRFLLEGYRQNHRQDNSILRVSVNLTLLVGDPCFKLSDGSAAAEAEALNAPGSHIPQDGNSPSPDSSPMQPNRGLPPSTDDDYSSLPRRQTHPDGGSSGGSSAETPPPSGLNLLLLDRNEGCSVHESGAGLYSSDYGTYGTNGCSAGQSVHQRQHSSESGSGHLRNSSSGSSYCDTGSLKDRSKRNSHRNPLNVVDERNPKMDSTRQDPNYLIDQLLLSSKLSPSLSVGDVVCPSPIGGLSSGPDSGVGIEHDSETESGCRHYGRDVVAARDSYH